MIYAQGMGMPVAVGTAADIADQMEHYMDDGGADGFMLAATYTPGCFEEFADFVVPELQRRGGSHKIHGRNAPGEFARELRPSPSPGNVDECQVPVRAERRGSLLWTIAFDGGVYLL